MPEKQIVPNSYFSVLICSRKYTLQIKCDLTFFYSYNFRNNVILQQREVKSSGLMISLVVQVEQRSSFMR